ncbi:maleylpyruvate isomerase family mycothiol-dependent enzyme [Mycobacterium sp. MYCO198283]|uniref:maleylpyruvate isomerase family mycothiol-dependent enzyme n=1 Tax=Mycobacterium sp. MYCO198283 TaxID=2883505 RepID=UPI001E4FE6E3|nr:maleylpyruvate isomerase family mycothiol-dependent enzyme [Mycobacterium sp. MYCO198283]MCG5433984.1 maleylpyruvate isomerase family mycothiol-dependent enzyme [Mycobacterium sp. MYCO198283]
MTTVRILAREERAEFADLLAALTPQQWDAASLCQGWTVRDVAAHTIAYLDQSKTRLVIDMLRHRWDVDRLNAAALERFAGRTSELLVRLMRDGMEPAGAGALYGGRVALIECLVHQQDIRRPLGCSRTIPPDRLRAAMNYARISPVIGGARRTRGVRLAATDMDWSAGRGPEVRGKAEALLLTMTGRLSTVVGELAGDGLQHLRKR